MFKMASPLLLLCITVVAVNAVEGLDVLISFKGSKTGEILQSRSLEEASLKAKLANHAAETQGRLLKYLESRPRAKSATSETSEQLEFHSLWSVNKIAVSGADEALIGDLRSFVEVEDVVEDKLLKAHLAEPRGHFEKPEEATSKQGLPTPAVNLVAFGAPAAWEKGYTGRGVTIGVIDTGVNSRHLLLRSNMKPVYGWHDPVTGSVVPYDDHGHGTHSIGIATGLGGIGVAPGADYIACKALDRNGQIKESWVAKCVEHMICPKPVQQRQQVEVPIPGPGPGLGRFPRIDMTQFTAREDPEECGPKPRIVLIPWTMPEASRQLDEAVKSLEAAGILTIVSAGDMGARGCGSILPPADLAEVFSVGSMNHFDRKVLPSSGSGPGLGLGVKPELVAPGFSIMSASEKGPFTFAFNTGSDPAAAHVAGLAALALQKNGNLTAAQLKRNLLMGTGTPNVSTEKSEEECGGAGEGGIGGPNHVTGFGFADARLAVNMIPKFK